MVARLELGREQQVRGKSPGKMMIWWNSHYGWYDQCKATRRSSRTDSWRYVWGSKNGVLAIPWSACSLYSYPAYRGVARSWSTQRVLPVLPSYSRLSGEV